MSKSLRLLLQSSLSVAEKCNWSGLHFGTLRYTFFIYLQGNHFKLFWKAEQFHASCIHWESDLRRNGWVWRTSLFNLRRDVWRFCHVDWSWNICWQDIVLNALIRLKINGTYLFKKLPMFMEQFCQQAFFIHLLKHFKIPGTCRLSFVREWG